MSTELTRAKAHQLRLEAGRQGIAEWEREYGALTTAELAEAQRTLETSWFYRTNRSDEPVWKP
jgi:hypothetical protein